MALFANIVPTEQAFRILDRFLFFGEDAITEIVCNSILQQQEKLVSHKCPFELQSYLTRDIYLDTINEANFYPEIGSILKRKVNFVKKIF
jgi:hypothetical protein